MSLFGSILKGVAGAGLGFLTGGPGGAIAGGVSALTSGIGADKSRQATGQAVGAQNAGIQQLIDAARAAQTQVGDNQRQSEARQIDFATGNRDYQYNLNAPTLARGSEAEADYAGFLNGDASGVTAFRNNTGYQDLLKTGLSAVNANASFRGARDSGAALKSLQDRATGIADRSAGSYLGNLGSLITAGQNARQLTANVGNNAVGQISGAIDGAADANSSAAVNTGNVIGQGAMIGADANSNAALVNGNNQANNITQLGSLGLEALQKLTGSSFAPKATPAPAPAKTAYSTLFSDPFAVSAGYNTKRLF